MSFGKIIGKESELKSATSGSTQPSTQPSTALSDKTKGEAILGKGSKVIGNLTFAGPVEIGGYVEGEINAQDKILITETAEINAKIIGAEVTIQGTVNGDIHATKRLFLKKPAKVFGNITSNNLSIEEGVVFEGKCSMSSTEKTTSTSKVAGSI